MLEVASLSEQSRSDEIDRYALPSIGIGEKATQRRDNQFSVQFESDQFSES